jgi:hypothetical protein
MGGDGHVRKNFLAKFFPMNFLNWNSLISKGWKSFWCSLHPSPGLFSTVCGRCENYSFTGSWASRDRLHKSQQSWTWQCVKDERIATWVNDKVQWNIS